MFIKAQITYNNFETSPLVFIPISFQIILLPILIAKALICTTRQNPGMGSGTSSKMMSLVIGLVLK